MKLRALVLLIAMLVCSGFVSGETINVYAGITRMVQYPEGNEIKGTATVAVRELLDATGLKYNILIMNWAQAQKQFTNDANSLIYAVARSPERESAFRWLVPLAKLDLRIARLTSRPKLKLKNFNDLINYRLAAVRNLSTHHMAIRAGLKEGEHLLLVDSSSKLFRMIEKHLVDFVFYESSISPAIIDYYGYDQEVLTVLDTDLPVQSPYLYLASNLQLDESIAIEILTTHQQLLKDKNYRSILAAVLPNSRH